jgi:hypothetical protein
MTGQWYRWTGIAWQVDATTYAGLTDGATVDLPTINTPLADALAVLAPLESPSFTGPVTSAGNIETVSGQFIGAGTGLTGTAAGLTAGAVTSIGNLTGIVTSTNRVTTISNGVITNVMLANGAVANLSGTNTGDQTNVTGNAGTVTTINGRIAQGANVTISGAGTAASPYSIAAAGGDPTVQFATSKATLVDADRVAIFDSAASFVPKHSLFSLVKSTLKTYFDTIYAAAAAYARTDIDTTFAQKAIITGGNLILGGVADGATGRSLLQSSTQAAAQTAIGIVTLTPAAYAALVLAGTTVPTTIYITTEP